MRIIGLDQSLSSTGLARVEYGKVTELKTIAIKVKSPITLEASHRRLERIEDEVAQFVAGADFVAVEALGYGAKGRSLTGLAGLQWILRHRIWEEGIPYAEITPTQRSRFATGFGNSPKEAIVASVQGPLFGCVGVANDDEADAVVLAAAAARWYGEEFDSVPEEWRDTLELIAWPDI